MMCSHYRSRSHRGTLGGWRHRRGLLKCWLVLAGACEPEADLSAGCVRAHAPGTGTDTWPEKREGSYCAVLAASCSSLKRKSNGLTSHNVPRGESSHRHLIVSSLHSLLPGLAGSPDEGKPRRGGRRRGRRSSRPCGAALRRGRRR
eukprot:scaffold18297_cov50-Phaeocystis_antarctica.AAC.2